VSVTGRVAPTASNAPTIGRLRAVGEVKGVRLSGFVAWAAWLAVHLHYLTGLQNRLLASSAGRSASFVVVPANGGADRPSSWWLNLAAAGEGVAVLGRTRRRVVPREATAGERERLWRWFAAMSPVERYQEKTRRRIPVGVLAPAAAQR
jgi:hypothetical protein